MVEILSFSLPNLTLLSCICFTVTDCLPFFADHRTITKTQQSLVVEKHVDILKAQVCQDAPTLLDYIPSYKGKLKRKEKEVGEPSKKATTSKKGGK